MFQIILTFIIIASASNNPLETSTEKALKEGLVKPAVTDPLINEVVTYKPIADHHFNLEAPQDCGEQGTMDPTAREITCQFHTSGKRQVRLSVCDNAKKYCKQEIIKVTVRKQKSGTPRIKTAPTAETLKMQKETKKLLMASFKTMSPDVARQAVSTKKAALALVSTDWCPPCNMAKEFLLPTKAFKEATKDMLLIYVDGDSPASDEWKPLLKSRFYPTFIVLNKDLESISLFSDSDIKTNTKNISNALNHLGDSYSDLEDRIEGRVSDSLFQKVKDFFVSKESLDLDQKRFLKYLEARGKMKEKLSYMKAFAKNSAKGKYTDELIITEQKMLLFGQQDKSLSEEDASARKSEIEKATLELSPEGNDFYEYALGSFCRSTQVEVDGKKDKVNSKECTSYIDKYAAHLKTSFKKDWEQLSQAEQALATAQNFSTMASVAETRGNKNAAKKYYASCFDAYTQLYKFTPLKEKSRSVRLQQLYCLGDEETSKEKFKVLTSLVKDYPFEETFQRKLASYHLKNKDYQKAADYNSKALKYSYGAMWAYNMSSKAKILKGLKKDSEALTTLEKALQEFVLEKEGRNSRTIKMLRGQYEALKTQIEKKTL